MGLSKNRRVHSLLTWAISTLVERSYLQNGLHKRALLDLVFKNTLIVKVGHVSMIAITTHYYTLVKHVPLWHLSFIHMIASFWKIINTNTSDANFHALPPIHFLLYISLLLISEIDNEDAYSHCLHTKWSSDLNMRPCFDFKFYLVNRNAICMLCENQDAIRFALHAYAAAEYMIYVESKTWSSDILLGSRGFLLSARGLHQRRSRQSIQTMWF